MFGQEQQALRHPLATIRLHIGILWLVVLLALMGLFGASKWDELVRLGEILGRAERSWVVAAALAKLTAFGLSAYIYRVVFRRLGLSANIFAIAAAQLKALAVGAVIPLGGPASVYVFVHGLARRTGIAQRDVLFATVLSSFVGFASFILYLLGALALLQLDDALSSTVLTAAMIVIGLFLAASVILLVVLRGPYPPGWVQRRTPPGVVQLIEGMRAYQLTNRDLLLPFQLSLLTDLAGMAALYAALRAVGQGASLVTPIAGYQVEMLFNVIAPIFQGLGAVELSMALALEGVGVPVVAAVAATLIYRLWDLWVPLVLGLALYAAVDRRAAARGRSVDDAMSEEGRERQRSTLTPRGSVGRGMPLADTGHDRRLTSAPASPNGAPGAGQERAPG